MNNAIYEPGFWVLVGLVATAIAQLVGSMAASRHAKEFEAIVHNVKSDPAATADDERWVKFYASEAQSSGLFWMALVSPILLVVAPIAAVVTSWELRGAEEEEADDRLRGQISSLEAKRINLTGEGDISTAPLWRDKRRQTLSDLADLIQERRHPLALAVAIVFMVPGIIVFGVLNLIFGTGFSILRPLVRKLFHSVYGRLAFH